MLTLSVDKIIQWIEKGVTFEADAEDGSFGIKIEEYTPLVCAAIHSGHNLRNDLHPFIQLDENERLYEEDPLTHRFISSLPIVINGHDSRFEYDLNRQPSEAIYNEAWGKKVWNTTLTDEQRNVSIQKHSDFYRVVDALITKLENTYGACLVYDIHSYNYKRLSKDAPLFNIGTENIDTEKFGKYVRHWLKSLKKIHLPNIETTVAENDVFNGRGYFLRHITQNHPQSLVLATEIKKVYCDEELGEIYPMVVSSITSQLKNIILENTAYFARNLTNLTVVKRHKLLSSELDQEITKVDNQLYKLVKNFEILSYINPINLKQEQKRFFSSKFKSEPVFKYRQLNIHPFELRRNLYDIPVGLINDIHIRRMYQDVIHSFADKIDLLSSIGTNRFLYNSLRYFGEPNEADVANARFLLYCPQLKKDESGERYTAAEAKEQFTDYLKEYGFSCRIELSSNLVSRALVINHKRLLQLKRGATFSLRDIQMLTHHEIGVHMVTTVNARTQPLHVFQLGLPLNTLTQEGMAILSEYLSGNMSVHRLHTLCLRVIAVSMMVKGYTFRRTFDCLVEEYKMELDSAFYLTTRIFRGGGFTKDFLYLKGFRDILKYYKEDRALDNLLIGKTSLSYIDIITEMVDRKLILPPQYKTIAFFSTPPQNPILDYLIDAIR